MSVRVRAGAAGVALVLVLTLIWCVPVLSAPSFQAATLDDAMHAVVRIRGCSVQGCNRSVGSGAIIDASGLILTAHHVTLSNALDPLSPQLEDFIVELTDDPRAAPVPRYRARVVAQKPNSDFALLRIYWDEAAGREVDVSQLDLPHLPLADPDSVGFDDVLAILGYPLAGGTSINRASEGLSGFDRDGGGSLLKVQKSLSEGNSGGPALVQRADGYKIAGIVIERRGSMGEVGLIRSIGELHDLAWAPGGQRAVVSDVNLAFTDSALEVRMDMRLFDLVGHRLRLLAYAFDDQSRAPFPAVEQGLPGSAGSQLVLAAEVQPQSFVEDLEKLPIRLNAIPGKVSPADLAFRLALWDVDAGQLLWADSQWRKAQTQALAVPSIPTGAARGAPTATQTQVPQQGATPTPIPATPTLVALPVPTFALTPDVTAIAAQATINAALHAILTTAPTAALTPVAIELILAPTSTPARVETATTTPAVYMAVPTPVQSVQGNTGTVGESHVMNVSVTPERVPTKVGLVTDVGGMLDGSESKLAWNGIRLAISSLDPKLGNTAKYLETANSEQIADNIQQFVDAGYNIIVTVGSASSHVTTTAAKQNPTTYFIGLDQAQNELLPNLTSLMFLEDQQGFLAGALAATLTKSGTISGVFATDLTPQMVRFAEGFKNGARYIKPDIKVINTFHPGIISQAFIDPEWGAATAEQSIGMDADVVFGAGGLTGDGALLQAAAQYTDRRPLYCIGIDTDKWETLPAARPCLVSSVVKDVVTSIAVLIVYYAKHQTTITTDFYNTGPYYGMVGLAPFHDFEGIIPDTTESTLRYMIPSGFGHGSLETGVPQ